MKNGDHWLRTGPTVIGGFVRVAGSRSDKDEEIGAGDLFLRSLCVSLTEYNN